LEHLIDAAIEIEQARYQFGGGTSKDWSDKSLGLMNLRTIAKLCAELHLAVRNHLSFL